MRSAKAMTQAINLRVSVEERQAIEDHARKAGMSLSNYIRAAALGYRVSLALSRDLRWKEIYLPPDLEAKYLGGK